MGRFAINFATGLINGGLREWKAAKAEQDKRDLDTLSKATPETRQQYTEADGQQLEAIANARDASGNPIYELTANPDASYGVRVAGDGGGSAATISPKATTTFLGKTFAGQPTDRQVQDTRMRAMANVLARSNPAQAQAMLTGMDVADRERERADRESVDNRELRAVLAGGGAAQAVASAAIGAGSGQSMPVAGGAFPATEAGQAVQAAASPPSPWAGQLTPAAYMRTAVPNVVTTLMRQGKFDQAQKFMKFADSAIGQEYATAWHDGVMRLSAGDSAGAIKTFERLYNSNLLPDGRQVRMTPAQDGSGRFTATVYDGDGKVVGQQQGTAEQLASQAAVMLSPTNAVQFHAKARQEDRRQAATLDRQEQLETLRQQGRAESDAR